MRGLVAAVLTMMMAAPVIAQADDPAVAACEALIRQPLPNTTQFRRLEAGLAGPVVTILYEAADLAGFVRRKTGRCAFKLDAATAQWSFANDPSPETRRCSLAAKQGVAAMKREGREIGTPAERRRVAGCETVFQAERMSLAREVQVIAALSFRSTYPINQTATALRPAP